MRGFGALAGAVLVGIGVGVGALGATGATSTGTTANPGEAFAMTILDEAPLPSGSRAASSVPALLDQPMQTPAIPGLVDRHRFYVTSQSPNIVEDEVLSQLPKAVAKTGSGTFSGPGGSGSGFVLAFRTSGPNEYLAELVYSLAPLGSGSALRIDAQTVWVADRPVNETIPLDSTAALTGYAALSLARGSSGAVRVSLGDTARTRLIEALNGLSLAPRPLCMESSVEYQITFNSPAAVRWQVVGGGCAGTVEVMRNGEQLSFLDDRHCTVLTLVGADLPPAAAATKRAAAGCQGP